MTPELTKAVNALAKEFAAEIKSGDIKHLGITNCRTKNNQPDGPWSEHAWSNAVDVMLRNWPGRKALGDRIAKWMRAHPELWSEVFWQIAAHFDHVHGTANPRRNPDNKQVPPCAPEGGDDMALTPEVEKFVNDMYAAATALGSNGTFVTQAIEDIREKNAKGPYASAAEVLKRGDNVELN